MPDTITLDIPAHLAAAAQVTPEELKIELAIHLYTQDRLTLEEASELAGVEDIQQILEMASVKSKNEINKRITEINESFSYIFAVLSSEIRTPLTAIHGYADLLLYRTETETPLSENQKNCVKNISDYANDLLLFWEDTLNLAHIDADQVYLELEEIQLNEIIKQMFGEAPQHIKMANTLEFTLNDLPRIQADERWTKAILRFLILNNYHGQASVQTECVSNQVITTITSQIDIFPETLQELTKKEILRPLFTNWNNLWLLTSRYLIEKHGGTFHAENLKEGGSRVTFTLPVHPPEAEHGSLG